MLLPTSEILCPTSEDESSNIHHNVYNIAIVKIVDFLLVAYLVRRACHFYQSIKYFPDICFTGHQLYLVT